MAPSQKVYVVGVGMTKFIKPRDLRDYPDMGREAATKALLDAGITYDKVQQAAVGYCYGDSTCGQRTLYQLGMHQIPIINVNNNCSTGSTALFLARQAVEYGVADCTMALGFEKMEAGSLGSKFEDRTNPLDKTMSMMSETRGISAGPFAAQIFGNAGIEHMAKIAEKNHRHSALNPYSQFRDIYTLEQVEKSNKVFGPLTKLQCCPTSDGSACVILASEKFVREHNLQDQAVELVAQSMATDSPKLFNESSIELAGADMTRRAAAEVYAKAGIKPTDVQVVELHDCFSANELITYDALGLCNPGEAHKLIDSGDVSYGGKYVVNPSGGLISKGHPLGATGLAQCSELYALQHNVGLGGAVVISLYKKAELGSSPKYVDSRKRVGYNPATEAREVSEEEVESVRAKQSSEFMARL
ncbi:hypothetical protein CPC16_000981 [Podila verticillata]|nr:hypothetical protein CPC16_000981 [Podila verticillata]